MCSWSRFTAKEDLTFADLHMGNAMPTYGEYGYGYAVEKAPTTKGWTYRLKGALELRLPPGDAPLRPCARGKETPIATGEDGGSSRKFSWPAIARPEGARRSAYPSAPLASSAPSFGLGAADEDLSFRGPPLDPS